VSQRTPLGGESWCKVGLRLIVEEDGADIIEYALLASIIGVAGMVFFPVIRDGMSRAFTGWGQQVNSRWVPDPPSVP